MSIRNAGNPRFSHNESQPNDIQLIDFYPFVYGSAQERKEVASAIDVTLATDDFVYLSNHGIDQRKICWNDTHGRRGQMIAFLIIDQSIEAIYKLCVLIALLGLIFLYDNTPSEICRPNLAI